MCGAIGAATSRIKIGAGLTHIGTRHPLVLAAMGATLNALTEGRFVLGVGRGLPGMATALGIPAPSLDRFEHVANILQRLWRGEAVTDEVGPAGRFRHLRFVDVPHTQAPPTLVLGAIGERGLRLAGRLFDGVLLHPFLTPTAVARAASIARESAERSGRDPAAFRVIAALVTAPELSHERFREVVLARAVTYFQARGLGEALVRANDWSMEELARFQDIPQLRRGTADYRFRRSELGKVGEQLPDPWIKQAAAVGTIDECARRLAEYRDAGVDEIVIHGASPSETRVLIQILHGSPQ